MPFKTTFLNATVWRHPADLRLCAVLIFDDGGVELSVMRNVDDQQHELLGRFCDTMRETVQDGTARGERRMKAIEADLGILERVLVDCGVSKRSAPISNWSVP